MRASWSTCSSLLLFALLACARTPASTSVDVGTSEAGSLAGPIGEPTAAANEGAGERRAALVETALDPARLAAFAGWIGDNVEGERYRVAIEPGDLVFGVDDARVTITAFIDYQCPYSARLDQTLAELLDTHPTDVRVVYKQFPLPMHAHARELAEAVLAAAVQGRGQQLHRLVFANQRTLDRDALIELARQAGVPDMPRFLADLEQAYAAPQVERDIALGKQLALSSTPNFFINGAPHKGAKSLETLRELYAAELVVVERLLAQGALRHEVYASFAQAGATTRATEAKPTPTQPSARPGRPDPNEHYAVTVDGRPSKGRADALVTIIEFSDFECPYCSKVQATLRELERRYGKDLRVVYRHQPLPMHSHALDAARAAAAADRQGKFWKMHDLLFEAAEARTLGDYEALARQLGLDVDRFRADMADSKLGTLISEDQQLAARFGATGTPSFFVNGRYLGGAQPVEAFVALVDEELRTAKAYAAKHQAADLYASMARDWETEVEAPPLAEHARQSISVKGLPATGTTNKPKLSIVACFDFDCPYSKRGSQNMAQLLTDKTYAGKVGYYALHFPLPMHANAEGAHRAAIAAHEQGKFWEMHQLLFDNKDRRSMADFEDMARQLGLDLDRFRSDWSSQATSDRLAADKQTCSTLGVTGTPAYFINGRLMKGAVPLEMMTPVLDEELAGGFEAAAKTKSKPKSKPK